VFQARQNLTEGVRYRPRQGLQRRLAKGSYRRQVNPQGLVPKGLGTDVLSRRLQVPQAVGQQMAERATARRSGISNSTGSLVREAHPATSSEVLLPRRNNSINPGEWHTLQSALVTGETFATVTGALSIGDLRIGLHVQAIGEAGGSESFVTVIPEPEIYAMMGVGLGLMGWVARRRKQQAA